MNIGDEKGLILEKAIRQSEAKNILELGVYLGYSTIRILRNLENKSKLTSIESNEKFADIAREHINIAGLGENHDLLIENQVKLFLISHEQYDFIFIDHWKDLYLKDLRILKKKLIKKQCMGICGQCYFI